MNKTFTIKNGPGRWDMMLAVFNGQPITLEIKEPEGQYLNGVPLEVSGGSFYGRYRGKDNGVFDFYTTVPNPDQVKDGKLQRGGTGVKVKLNLHTRQGKMENPQWRSENPSLSQRVRDDELEL